MTWKLLLLTAALVALANSAAASFLYWSVRGVGGTGEIRRCDVDACVPETVVSGIDPSGIDIDTVNLEVYWVDTPLGQIRKADAFGGPAELVIDPTPGVDGGIAVDSVARKVYWSQNSAVRIARANLDGSSLETVVTFNEPGCPGTCAPFGIATDGIGSFIYWADQPNGEVRRRSTGLGAIETITTALNLPRSLTVDPIRERLFVGDATPLEVNVASTSSPPNAATPLVTVNLSGRDSLELGAGLLYIALPSAQKIQSCRVADCDDPGDLSDVVTGESVDGIAFVALVPSSMPAVPGAGLVALVAGLLLVVLAAAVQEARRRRG